MIDKLYLEISILCSIMRKKTEEKFPDIDITNNLLNMYSNKFCYDYLFILCRVNLYNFYTRNWKLID